MTDKTALVHGLGGRVKACAACGRTVARGRNYGHPLVPLHKACAERMYSGWNTGNLERLQATLARLIAQPGSMASIRWDITMWPRLQRPLPEPSTEAGTTLEVRLTIHRRPY